MIHLRLFFYIALIASIGIVTFTFISTYKSGSSISQDWTPISLPASGVYGFCRQDRNHEEGARFIFELKNSQSYRLVFFAGGKGDETNINLSLNGNMIAKPLSLPAGWGAEISIPLPSTLTRNGTNIVEVHPTRTLAGTISWGISEIRVLPNNQAGTSIRNPAVLEIGSIINALSKPNLSGRELAHYYINLDSWGISTSPGTSSHDRDSIMEEIEQKMKDTLHQVAFEVRSKNIQGDRAAARRLLDDTKSWIPADWFEGWEIYNELCR